MGDFDFASADDDLRIRRSQLRRRGSNPGKTSELSVPKNNSSLWRSLIKDEDIKDFSEEVLNVQKTFVHHVYATLARTPLNLDDFGAYNALAYTCRDRLIRRWIDTQLNFTRVDPKRVYYLSMEFLMGRTFQNAVLNLDLDDLYKEALLQLGFKLEDMYTHELDAALGNGGLGRLAACIMDSLATLDYPAAGYGLRYTYGIFEQRIINGEQIEFPDYWLTFGNPWEIQRLDVVYNVSFGGSVTSLPGGHGEVSAIWEPSETIQAVAYDVPIPGHHTPNCAGIRLWSAKPNKQFNLEDFNAGRYMQSVAEKQNAENITQVLYPNDNTPAGKELRLRQQYFFVCATLQDILRRFKKTNRPWSEFPKQVSIQLNDTHPTLGIVELQRILIDKEGLPWDAAWNIVTNVFAYTNHTVLPEALEVWSVDLMQSLLPRHMKIIFDINLFFLQAVESKYPNDRDRLRRMSIIQEGSVQMVRMAHLAVVGSHAVNGVAKIHSELVKSKLLPDFVEFYGAAKFTNVTNGITPRRWLNQANPELSRLITKALNTTDWTHKLELLKGLRANADDPAFQLEWMGIKRQRKVILAEFIKKTCNITVNPDALFDVQVKRIHEYKRQFMNALGVVHKYLKIKAMSSEERKKVVPRVVIFGGKAAPGYFMAKQIIKLINHVAKVVNNDEDVGGLLKVVFVPNYNVSLAEIIIPASDISQHTSTAGTEASGTSNMKFVLNGGLILGTLDGANIEIRDEIGPENMFIFGATAEEVDSIRQSIRYRLRPFDSELDYVVRGLRSGMFGDVSSFNQLIQMLVDGNDYYIVSYDFPLFLRAQEKVDQSFLNKSEWAKKSIMCTAGMGFFSSDRTVKQYAEKIWHLEPCRLADFHNYLEKQEQQQAAQMTASQ